MLLHINSKENLLPYDGIVQYYQGVLNSEEAAKYFEWLKASISWKQDEVVIFGKRHITKRETAWYGEGTYVYSYSNTSRQALPFTIELLELKSICESVTGTTYNSCLLNLYHNGHEGMGWHSDDEKMLQEEGTIASLSLGAERNFLFRHRCTREKVSLKLEDGSLLAMRGATQKNWLHSLPKSAKIHKPRINLTFRTFVSRL